LRVRSAEGKWIYVQPIKSPNHKLKPLYGLVEGIAKKCSEGTFHLRYRHEGKRHWQSVGSDAELALSRLQQKAAELTGAANGLTLASPVRVPEIPIPPAKRSGRPLKESAAEYVKETKEQKAPRTYNAYQRTLALLIESCSKELIEDVDRLDLLKFVTSLRDKGNAPWTIRNRVDYVQIFLHHFGLPSPLKGKDLPTYTDKKVRAYSEADLGKLFGHAN
jgi:integrase/recombinase XerD